MTDESQLPEFWQAIDNGQLVFDHDAGLNAGLFNHVALTVATWEKCVAGPANQQFGNQRNLWEDVLFRLIAEISKRSQRGALHFVVEVTSAGGRTEVVPLKAIPVPDGDGFSALIVQLLDEGSSGNQPS